MGPNKGVMISSNLHGSYTIMHASGVKFHCDGTDISWRLPDCIPMVDDTPLEVITDYFVQVQIWDDKECKVYVQEAKHVAGVLQLFKRGGEGIFVSPQLVIHDSAVERVLELINMSC